MPIFIREKITIIRARKPVDPNVNDLLQWFGSSLGLFGIRDRDKSCFRVFLELLKAVKMGRAMSSDELALRTGLTRATVVHHLNNLMVSGLVVHEGNRYILRASKLHDVVDEIQKDMSRTLEDLKSAASKIDERLGL
ncbi:MAG: ArsR family transcriptional regulator [Nanoarchaeota archaeon]|nr:ArsR family transcriptional regulator [Nanoarchaeota archaeon]MBU1704311.1 ArsR family transcriptional regulator [Nanoarchaeota archaeon]